MKYFPVILVGILILCLACHYPDNQDATKEEQPNEELSPFAFQLLEWQYDLQKEIDHCVWLCNAEKLPDDSLFICDIQCQAVLSGSRYALKNHYRTISSPPDTALKYLDLSSNNIFYIPDKVTRYPRLNYLSLRYNRIQEINPKLGQCKSLKKIDLSSNQIDNLPFGIIYLSQISELNLADNKLSSLPNFFFNLYNLKVLDISNLHTKMAIGYNNIIDFPKVLLRMHHLEKLFLDKLPIRSLPSNMSEMKQLKVVSLNGARQLNLDQAFEALSKLPNLIALDLSFMGRRTLPPSISKLKNLKVLIWHEEYNVNESFIRSQLGQLLPNTKVYHGARKEATPFLRGNSVKMLKDAGY